MLTLIRGLPGSGKTTYAKQHYPEDRHYETDMYFTNANGKYEFDQTKLGKAHNWCIFKTSCCLWRGDNVVVSNTFSREWEMMPYLLKAREHKHTIKLIELQRQFESIHEIPKYTFDAMKQRWERFVDMRTIWAWHLNDEISLELEINY